jgi:UDP-glucose 4-epimerase
MKVLITGGAGFIGSHLCDAFIERGDDVTILDNLSTGSKKNISHLHDRIQVFEGDIRDQNLVESLISKTDLVMHMAAALGVENILENPIESISTNFYGSEVVLNATAKYDKRVIISSTSEIYGKNPKQPLSETDDRIIGAPQKLRWTYSDAKSLEEANAHFLFLTKNLRVTTVRFFNTVGPRQIGKYGMVLPRFIESAVGNKPLNIYGDGSQSRVFCHIQDAVRALILLALNDKTIGQVFNLGGVGEITIKDLANLIIRETHSKSIISFTRYEKAYAIGFEEMMRRVPDITKINMFTGWRPEKGLIEIIQDVVAYLAKEI